VRVTSHQGVWEGHTQGEAAQVVAFFFEKSTRCAYSERMECHYWKATCMEIVHAWFGEGRMEKDLYRYLASRLFHDTNPGAQIWTTLDGLPGNRAKIQIKKDDYGRVWTLGSTLQNRRLQVRFRRPPCISSGCPLLSASAIDHSVKKARARSSTSSGYSWTMKCPL